MDRFWHGLPVLTLRGLWLANNYKRAAAGRSRDLASSSLVTARPRDGRERGHCLLPVLCGCVGWMEIQCLSFWASGLQLHGAAHAYASRSESREHDLGIPLEACVGPAPGAKGSCAARRACL